MIRSKRLGSSPQLRLADQNSPILKNGSKGEGVAAMQSLLADLGFKLPHTFKRGKADGIFGHETAAAIKEFQRRVKLKADGLVGNHTLEQLDGIVLTYKVLEKFDDADERRALIKGPTTSLYLQNTAMW